MYCLLLKSREAIPQLFLTVYTIFPHFWINVQAERFAWKNKVDNHVSGLT